MRLRDWPIARRITGALILLAVATALALQAGGFYLGRRQFAESARKTLEVAARKSAAQLDEILRKARADLKAMAQDRAIVDLCLGKESPRAAPMLDAHRDSDGDLSMLLVAGNDGRVLTSSPLLIDEGANIRARPYYAPARAGRVYQSGMLWGRTGFGVYLSQPVKRIDEVLGVLVLKLDGNQLGHRIRDMTQDPHGLVGVLYEKLGPRLFVVLASGDPDLEFTAGKPLSEPQRAEAKARWNKQIRILPVTALVDSGASGVATQGGVEWVFGLAELEEAPWVVLTRQSRKQFEAGFFSLVLNQLWILLIVLAFAGLLAYSQARSILRPVRTLTVRFAP
ncbi:MAG: cache domain-containing protein [Planctomycetota bacterium]|jgi:C4-dicarboxylate-specific signal transduction histidine kinase